MEKPVLNEMQLAQEIGKLREAFPGTQDLYREVCALLFFRHGVTPTANKLYQLVRRGSMSAPAEALTKFWSDLREKSRVRIEHPDLPENLRIAAGELTATLWTAAQAAATDSLAEFRNEAHVAVTEAKTTTEAAQAKLAAAHTALEKSHHEREQAKAKISQLEQELAAERATLEEVRAQLSKAEAEIVSHLQAQESARRYFTEELEKLKTAAKLEAERYTAAERRFLLETDRERQIASRLQKDIEQLRQEGNRLQDRQRTEINNYQVQIGDFKHQLGVLEGRLQGASIERDQLARDLHTEQKRNSQLVAREAELQGEVERWRTKAMQGEKTLLEWKTKPSSPSKRTRSAPTDKK